MDVETTRRTRAQAQAQALAPPRALRWLPLAGVGYAVLQTAGDLTIGPFPDTDAGPALLVSYYAAHHEQVSIGGRLLELSGIFLALLGVAIWARLRTTAPVLGVAALVGAAMSAADAASAGATYRFVADLGAQHGVSPAVLQSWHALGSGFGVIAGTVLLLLAVAVAGIVARAVPQWLGWVSLLLAAATLSPFGFLASLAFVLWAAIAGIALIGRPARSRGQVVTEAVAVNVD
jgi:hypothetical protein